MTTLQDLEGGLTVRALASKLGVRYASVHKMVADAVKNKEIERVHVNEQMSILPTEACEWIRQQLLDTRVKKIEALRKEVVQLRRVKL